LALVITDLSTGKRENLAGVMGKINFVHGLITDLEATSAVCRGADYVLHLAAMTSVPRSVKDPVATNRVNVDGTVNVLVAARDSGVRRVVFASSSAIYGETPTLPKREDMPPRRLFRPTEYRNWWASCMAAFSSMPCGVEFVSLRYFNVFGPRQDPGSPYSGVLSLFIAAMRNGGSPLVYGDCGCPGQSSSF
jgi:UDP-glucose 4-epimerase